ncbi:MAG TPA: hypothetical protein VGJ75_13750 [Dongiaceae bacterium]
MRVYIAVNEEGKGLDAAERAVAFFIDLRDWFHAATVKRTTGRILRRKQRVPEARKAFGEALALFQQAGAKDEIAATQQEMEQIEKHHGMRGTSGPRSACSRSLSCCASWCLRTISSLVRSAFSVTLLLDAPVCE